MNTRFINKESIPDLMNLWHQSRMMGPKRINRLHWTKEKFSELYPKISKAMIYKDLTALTEGY